MDSTIVVTFCEHGENTIKGKHLGEMAKEGDGFSLFDLQKACIWCKNNNVKYELWDLTPGESLGAKPSYLLIMRRYAHKFEDPNSLYQELKNMAKLDAYYIYQKILMVGLLRLLGMI